MASFIGLTAFTVLSAAFSVHYTIEYSYPYWLAVSGSVVLFLSGCVGHIGRQMAASSSRFSASNLIFYFLCLSSTGLIAAATGLPSFGDSSIFCTVTTLGLCTPFEPKTKIGLWEKCEVSDTGSDSCTSWSDISDSGGYDWAINLIFAFYIMVRQFLLHSTCQFHQKLLVGGVYDDGHCGQVHLEYSPWAGGQLVSFKIIEIIALLRFCRTIS